jgi:hypothetical protein
MTLIATLLAGVVAVSTTVWGVGLGFAIICAIANYFIAKSKGRGVVLWTILGFIFSWVAVIVCLVLPRKN